MITQTRNNIIKYIKTRKQARVHDLVNEFGLSNVAIHKQLRLLLQENVLKKVGKPPLVFYTLAKEQEKLYVDLPKKEKEAIEANYLYISPQGELLYGLRGFIRWVLAIKEEKKLPHLAAEYVETLNKIKKYKNTNDFIDATEKIKATFSKVYLDKLLYADFFSLPKFGKTKLGQLVLYAKQSQNKKLIKNLGSLCRPLIKKIIDMYAIDTVSFIPPTVPRKTQFMNEFALNLRLNTPLIELVKSYSGEVIVAQKTLARLEERIENARSTIYLKHNAENSFPNVLLIDDAAGSGSTFNETARKMKSVMIGKKSIIAFSIVGSFKGFDVIREV